MFGSTRSTAVTLAVLGLALVAAVVLARPERIPADLAPPPRSAASTAPEVEPAREPEAQNNAESAGEDPGDEPIRGRALNRQDLELGLLKVRAHAMACRAEAPPPVVPLHITIAPSGGVVSVGLPAEVKGTRAGDCIVRAIRTAVFPAWTEPPVPNVEWDYALRFEGAAAPAAGTATATE